MNALKIVLLFLLMQSKVFAASTHRYSHDFDLAYSDAEIRAKTFRGDFIRIGKKYNEDWRILESIIFPELIRKNVVSDVIESGSLYALYCGLGKDYANFSIGEFQMKPSFAESIEYALKKNCPKGLEHNPIRMIDLQNTADFRAQRLDRLGEVDWQVNYLIAMVKLLRYRFPQLQSMSRADQVVFLSSAYNAGWTLSFQQILNFTKKKYFHLGTWLSSERYCYATISARHYRSLTMAYK